MEPPQAASKTASAPASAAPAGDLKACGLRPTRSQNTSCNTGTTAPQTPGCLPHTSVMCYSSTQDLSPFEGSHHFCERPSPGLGSQTTIPAREAPRSPAPEDVVLCPEREESFSEPEEGQPREQEVPPPATDKGEEVRSPPPPQLRPPPLRSGLALLQVIPCPLLLDTLPVCLDLPAGAQECAPPATALPLVPFSALPEHPDVA
ncbi:UNVERIFIED_CONTAM: hypothetical protein FKN15_018301 [Acipenser sinensis]